MVYHIADINSKYKVGDIILPKVYNMESFSLRKREIEICLENVRKERFSSYPSRLHCLYVCYCIDDVHFWLHMKKEHIETDFKLLILDLEHEPVWLSSESYHKYYFGFSDDLEKCANLYWSSKGAPEELDDCEGLYYGKAIIKRICKMRYTKNNDIIPI